MRKVTPLTPLSIQRTLQSVNQYRGTLNVAVRNNLDADIRALYLETMPWLVQFFLHSLQIECNGLTRSQFFKSFHQQILILGDIIYRRLDFKRVLHTANTARPPNFVPVGHDHSSQ